MKKSTRILYCSSPERGQVWKDNFASTHPNVEFSIWPHVEDLASIDVLVVWKVPDGLIKKLHGLKAIFTVSAGIDQIDLNEVPSSVEVIRMIDEDLANQLAEYTTMSVLMIYRRLFDYLEQQKKQQWLAHEVSQAKNFNVGIMGLGIQGRRILERLKPYQFTLSGWSKSRHNISDVKCYDKENLDEFLSGLSILVCVLPLTNETREILDGQLFKKLPQGCSVINIGRGEHLVESDLLLALESGQISHAVLDVFQHEPLSEDNPLWKNERVIITPHVAGLTRPESGFESIKSSLELWLQGNKPPGWIDRKRGY